MAPLSSVALATALVVGTCFGSQFHGSNFGGESLKRSRDTKHQIPRDSHPRFERFNSIDNPFSNDESNKFGSSSAGIYGIAGAEYADGAESLVYYDASTGEATTIANGDSSLLTGQGLGCVDNINNIYYYIYETVTSSNTIETGLYGYNLVDPTSTIDPITLPMVFSDDFVGAGDACLSDPNTGDIYVFGHSANDTTVQLLIRVSRDSSTNEVTTTIVTTYENLDDIPLLSGPCEVYDSKRNKMWIAASVGDDTSDVVVDWFYIDAATGNIEKNISDLVWTMATCNYDASIDAIIGIEFNSEEQDGNFSFVLKTADPVTLEITSNFDPIDEWCTYTDVETYDSTNSIQYQIIFKNPFGACVDMNGTLIGHLVGMDATSGQLVSSPEMCNGILDCPWNMQYWAGASDHRGHGPHGHGRPRHSHHEHSEHPHNSHSHNHH